MTTPLPVFRAMRGVFAVLAIAASTQAQAPLPPEPVRFDSPTAFKPMTENWKIAGDLAGDPRHEKTLSGTPGTELIICNPGKTKETRGHLFTSWEHGDIELDLDFLMTTG